MSEPDWKSFSAELREGGVSPRYVQRAIAELQDHYAELEAEAQGAGLGRSQAAKDAALRLGDPLLIAGEILKRPELRSRYRVFNMQLAALSGSVITVDLNHPLVRWSQASIGASLFTVGLLLVLQFVLLG